MGSGGEYSLHDPVNVLFNFVHKEEEDSDLTNLREAIKEKLVRLITQVDRCADEEALGALRKGLSK